MSDESFRPGWYTPVDQPGVERWWDGQKWTEHTRPPREAPVAQPSAAAAGARLGTSMFVGCLTFILLCVALLFIIAVAT